MMTSLLRQTARKLGSADSSLRTAGAALYSTAPALASTKSNWSFLTGVFGRPPPPLSPLGEPLVGVKIPEVEKLSGSKLETTKLENGLQIASEPFPGPCTTVGLYINSGSIFESPEVSGISHLLERMAFKSTANRSHFRLIRELEAIGANPTVSVSRDHTCYAIDGIKTYIPEFVELLADSVLNPVFHDWEVEEQINTVRAQIQMLSSQPEPFLMEAVHSTAFAGALANPLQASEGNLPNLSGEVLYNYVKANYTPGRMVLVATGVDHSELKALAAPLFEDLPAGEDIAEPVSQYIGGEWRSGTKSEFSHAVLAFEQPGGWLNEKDSVTSYVLQLLMGGGGAFSAGGPGKGMTSRLYRRVLGGSEDVQNCYFFNSLYDHTGLVGVYTSATHDHIGKTVNTLTKELLAITNPQNILEQDLNRAKNATLASVLFALESRQIVAEDVGRQLLTYGERKHISEFKAQLAGVTAHDVSNLAQKIFSTPLTLAAIGNVGAIDPYHSIAARFK